MDDNRSIPRKRGIHNRWDHDLLSDLPLNIIHSILTLVPIRDAVRTSILSSQWRYNWATLPHLAFDHQCVDQTKSVHNGINCLKNVVTNALFLHQGPIQRFELTASMLNSCPSTDRWILCLSRNEIKELFLTLGYSDSRTRTFADGYSDRWFRVHSSLYSCRNLTHLELSHCELPPPPPTFSGFSSLRTLVLVLVRVSSNAVESLILNSPLLESLTFKLLHLTELRISAPIKLNCLRSLVIHQVRVPSDVVESLIANSPLLENLTFESLDPTELRISAPNLKCFNLFGDIKEISFYAPLVVQVSVSLYKGGFTAQLQQSSVCNYVKFLGGFTNLERLIGYMRLAEYLSVGIESYDHSLVFHHLKSIHLYNMTSDDKKQLAIVGHLIMDAPNLHELKFFVLHPRSNASEAPPIALSCSDLGWAPNFTINKLRVVEVVAVCGFRSEMEFIKILLTRSTVLETMTLGCYNLGAAEISTLTRELLSCRQASLNAKILIKR